MVHGCLARRSARAGLWTGALRWCGRALLAGGVGAWLGRSGSRIARGIFGWALAEAPDGASVKQGGRERKKEGVGPARRKKMSLAAAVDQGRARGRFSRGR